MEKVFKCSKSAPVVQTEQGKLRGYFFDGVYNFFGIPYAKANRFCMPEKPDKWDGVRDALAYGLICPLIHDPVPGDEVVVPHRFWPESEHCQNLQVWTPTLDPEQKLAVMVWFHGGGYSSGSAIEHVAYEGDGLARKYGVVMVGVNHRLNVFGHLDMSAYGEKYKNSCNAGIADLVAALEWVRDNISAFGGDPENVTIFGQSGGGGKVTTLGQSEAADGLFHKAIVMSGVFPPEMEMNNADPKAVAAAILEELEIPEAEAEKLEKVPVPALIAAVKRVEKKFGKKGLGVDWGPRANYWYAGDPLKVGFRESYLNVPTIVGSVFSEFFGSDTEKEKSEMTEEEREAAVFARYGKENGEKVLTLYKEAYPGKDTAYAIGIDPIVRKASALYCRVKASSGKAPVYSYMFSHSFSYDNGRSPWHCADIPFCFANSDKVPFCYSIPDRVLVEQEMAGAFTAFAKTGDPNGEGLVEWHPSDGTTLPTLVVDETGLVEREDFDDALVACVLEAMPPFAFDFSASDDEDEEGSKWLY